jgi:NADH-quinone oxidoreductase subunit M
LFVLAGVLQERLHTRDLRRMGGLWAATPRLGAVALFFVLASLGLPGLGNFVAEFLVLAGSFRANPIATSLATIGFVLATVYALALMQRAFFGARAATDSIADLSPREWLIFGAMMAGLIYLGLFPDGVFRLLEHVVRAKSML